MDSNKGNNLYHHVSFLCNLMIRLRIAEIRGYRGVFKIATSLTKEKYDLKK